MFKLEDSYLDIINNFKNAKKNDKLAHAYLFSSNKDKNVKNIVKSFMMMFYCENLDDDNNPCLECENCLKIINDKHINFYEVDSTGISIKKEQIEKLQTEFSKTSLEEGIRVYLIDNCEKMTPSSANSLLKFLEEPTSQKTFAFLITNNIAECLPTILSRCQIIKMHSKTSREIYQSLDEEIDDTLKRLLSNFCSNTFDAITLSEDSNFIELVDFLKKMMQVIQSNNRNLLEFYRNNSHCLYVDKENIITFYHLALYYFLDLLKLNLGLDDTIFNSEKEIQLELIKYYKENKIYQIIQYIKESIKRLYFNINEGALVDEFILKIRM